MIRNPSGAVAAPGGGGGLAVSYEDIIAASAPDYGWDCQDVAGALAASYGGVDLAKTGNPTYEQAGPWDGAVSLGNLDGSNFFESAADLPAMNINATGAAAFSLEGLIYVPEDRLVWTPSIFGYGSSTFLSGAGFALGQNNGTAGSSYGNWPILHKYGIAWLPMYDVSGNGFRESPINKGWHHIAFTVYQSDGSGPGNTTRFHIDGEVFGVSAAGWLTPNNTCRMCIGTVPVGHTAPGQATIRVCHVYAYARRLGIGEMKARVTAMNLLAFAPSE
jgi:hypothetical protein